MKRVGLEMSEGGRKKNEMGIRVLPPFIFLIALIVAFLVERFLPVPLVPAGLRYSLGGALMFVSLAPMPWVLRAFIRAKTSIDARHNASSLIVDGLYQYSRNPIYVAMITLCIGIGIMADNIWVLPALVAAIFYLFYTVIVVEERYLEAKFGDEYRDYKRRVRRWL